MDGVKNKIEKIPSLLGPLFAGRKRSIAPRPLGSGMSSEQPLPAEGDSVAAWTVWCLDGSAVASSFWGLCLWAPDKAWEEAKVLYAARAQDIFENDGSMSLGRFCHMSCDLLEEEGAPTPGKALDRFAAMAADPVWGPWLSGTMALASGGPRGMRHPPPLLEFYAKALAQGWEGALALAPLARASIEPWMARLAEMKKEESASAPQMRSLREHGWSELARALALGGSIEAVPGEREDEKAIARLVGADMDKDSMAGMFAEALRLGSARAVALAACWGSPEPKLLAQTFAERNSGMFSSSDESVIAAQAQEDARALLLAQSLGWIGAKGIARAAKQCQKAGRSGMAAALEAAVLAKVAPEASVGPKRRL